MERRVSVRLVGVGGEALKSLLTELGDTGERAFHSIANSAGPASTSMLEIDKAARAAGVEMKGLYERTALASAVMRSAALGAQNLQERIEAAGLANRNFKTAADEVTAYGRVLDNLRATYNPLYAAQRQYHATIEDIRQAQVAGALSTEEMTRALEREAVAYQQSVIAIQKRQAAVDAAVAAARGPNLAQRVDAVTGVTGGMARDQADIDAYGQALDQLRAKHNPMFAVIQQYKAAQAEIRQAHRAGAISADEMTAAISRQRQAALASIDVIKGRNTYIAEMSTGANIAAYRMSNLAFQLNDIGVSLAGGMNPFLVMAQQGTQIAQIYGFGRGGVNALIQDLAGTARVAGQNVLAIAGRFPVVTAAIALGTGALALMRNEINETTGASVSMSDVGVAAFQVLAERIYSIGQPVFDTLRGWWDNALAWANWAFQGIVDGMIWMGDLLIKGWKVQSAVLVGVWQGIPDAVGALAIAAANTVIAALNFMIEKAISGINKLAELGNAALESVGLDPMLTVRDPAAFRIEDIENPYAANLGNRRRALEAQIRGIMSGSPLGDYFADVRDRALQLSVTPEDPAAGGGGGGGGAAREVEQAAEQAARGWDAVAEALAKYAEETQNWGAAIGTSLVGAFTKAEDALVEFVKTGKADMRELASSIIADFVRIGARTFITGPLSNLLGSALSGLGGIRLPSFDGGGHTGFGPRSGGMDGRGGFLAMLHPRERVYDETRRGGAGSPVYVTIQTQDVESFRRSRAQVGADIQRAVARGRRAM